MYPVNRRLMTDLLTTSAEQFPDQPAVIDDDRTYTYAELFRDSARLAVAFQDGGVVRGDRIVIYLDNSYACAAAVFAAGMAGAVFVVINPQTKTDKLRHILADCGASGMVTTRELERQYGPACEGLPDLKIIVVKGQGQEEGRIRDFDSCLSVPGSGPRSARIIPSDLAGLIYTSGTTGLPKGVMLTHLNMVFTTGSLVEYLRLDKTHRILCVLPMSFDYGLYQLFMAVATGSTLVLEKSFTFPAPVFEKMRDHEVTVFPGVPTIFATMIALHERRPLVFPAVRRVTNTAAALHPELLPKLREIFPEALIYKMYGQTECKRVCYLEPELLEQYPASVGRAIPGTETMVLDAEGRPVPPGEPGILHVRGPHVMAGYWNKPEATAEMLRPGPVPGERMLCTHDWFIQDEQGLLYFQGRSDDIIKTRGEKVSPKEVENILHGIEGVFEAAVLGVEDEILGQAIRALIVKKDGAETTEADIIRICRQKLEGFMVPRDIVFLDALPHTDSGKIDRKKLWARAGTA